MYDNTIFKEWLLKGNSEKEPIFKFLCYFIAFNYLYNAQNTNPEWARLRAYVEANYSKLNNLSTNKFNELSKDVKDEKRGEYKSYILNETNKITRLFLNIYQVRCNLFHGSKSMKTERNIKLINESNEILKDFLTRIMDEKKEGATNA